MAALEIIALDTATPQLRAPGTGDTYSAPRAVGIAPESVTGSASSSALSITQTWNTTGTPAALAVDITNTASNVASMFARFRLGGANSFRFFRPDTGANHEGWLAFGSNGGDIGIGGNSGGVVMFGRRASTLAALDSSGGGDDGVFKVAAVGAFGWSSVAGATNTADVLLRRDAADTLALRRSTNAQTLRVYNTFTDASNYERGFTRWSSNVFEIGMEAAGTGSNRRVQLTSPSAIDFSIGGGVRWTMTSGGNISPSVDNAYDVGTANTNRARNGFWGGYHEMSEMTAPAAPSANNVRIYAEDNGAGKTRLMARFATGAAQQIAIEP